MAAAGSETVPVGVLNVLLAWLPLDGGSAGLVLGIGGATAGTGLGIAGAVIGTIAGMRRVRINALLRELDARQRNLGSV